jgi:hypothetical protein
MGLQVMNWREYPARRNQLLEIPCFRAHFASSFFSLTVVSTQYSNHDTDKGVRSGSRFSVTNDKTLRS